MSANLLIRKENIFKDNIANLEYWDFSHTNLDEQSRLIAITTVASICYHNPNAIGKESLYKRLESESKGLPSSSFEFVPVLLTPYEVFNVCQNLGVDYFSDELHNIGTLATINVNIIKFGEWITHEGKKYLLTNYRAIVYDYETSLELNPDNVLDLRKRFNTKEECEIIKLYHKVFRFKVDLPTRTQMIRHRVNLQELSRRYVSGKRVPVEHYISSDKMRDTISKMKFSVPFRIENNIDEDLTGFAGSPMGVLTEEIELGFNTQQVIDICMNHYYKLLEEGVAPQEARRIIPQTAYSEFWMAFQPYQLENYFKLRDDDHAQWEVRQTAIHMKEVIKAA